MTVITVEEYSFFQAQELALVLPLFRLSATEYDVWNTLLGHMAHGGRVPLSRADLAQRLNIKPEVVSRATGRLRELGLIWRLNRSLWQINPQIAFKGTAAEWTEAINTTPDDVPEIPLPDYKVRPPRRTITARHRHLEPVD
ncbi:helix-turn-helix domain-containing protein [Nocardiopsis sp. L17-MgMaSL7]|uniref:helix-turn-helix domain-containing protein n=1 Tax=Nocardiopsis sp. L17-MgMaSL7 TaxID=1938893 RepID=UPI000D70D3CD|nr:helix-turn-helix domain-containing protein [Nocardiopsis sp. L17-MgMaSL7]PWV44617.1 Crp-like helix-turn-helix protein [Nocardiopsis sp. L17-MgMaSL7]